MFEKFQYVRNLNYIYIKYHMRFLKYFKFKKCRERKREKEI